MLAAIRRFTVLVAVSEPAKGCEVYERVLHVDVYERVLHVDHLTDTLTGT